MLTQTRYFPYSRQSKKKSHRGAITARMLANLLTIAGVDHVITMDLHVCLYAIFSLILWILMGS
jgi:phosphoribosylpyrophosphate synthetase